MFNVGAGEVLVILLIALIVLGPDKLPETARKVGNVMGELRRMSHGFQEEIRSAMDDTMRPPLEPVKDEPTTAEPGHAAEADDTPQSKSDDPAA
jgi:sec-independent protein translocase protein TatB